MLSSHGSPFEKTIFPDYRSTSIINDYTKDDKLSEIAQRCTMTPGHVIMERRQDVHRNSYRPAPWQW